MVRGLNTLYMTWDLGRYPEKCNLESELLLTNFKIGFALLFKDNSSLAK
jgi:hypothetical protein